MLNRPILITGCARSGTSMTAGVIQRCGGWGGNLCGPTRYNPNGQYENTPIVNGFVKPFLRNIGYDPLGQDPLPDPEVVNSEVTIEFGNNWREKILGEIKNQGYRKGMRWFYKGAKLCLIWQAWHTAFPEAQWIITERSDKLIIDSCMRTSFMRKRTSRKSWKEWVDFHKNQFKAMENAGLDIKYINTENLVNNDFEETIDAIKHLGLTWNEKGVTSFIDIKIWNTAK